MSFVLDGLVVDHGEGVGVDGVEGVGVGELGEDCGEFVLAVGSIEGILYLLAEGGGGEILVELDLGGRVEL